MCHVWVNTSFQRAALLSLILSLPMLCGATESVPSPAGSAEVDDSEKALLADVDECRRLDRLRFDYVQHLRKAAPERLKVWQSAEARGSAAGLWLMAECYRNGIGVPQDWAATVDRFSRAALMDFAPAMHKLGILSKRGLGMPKDLELAASWHANAADRGYIEGMHDLANMYEAGSGVPLDQQKALELWRRAAEAGNELSMYALGGAYRRGDGVEIDIVTAKSWYERAAATGHLYAMERLAMLSLESDPPNDAEASSWIRKVAAALSLSDLIPSSDPVSMQWRKLCVELYDGADDIAGLAEEYEKRGAPGDYAQAVQHYQEAAEMGDAWAMHNVGRMYTNGLGVPVDHAIAAEWYRRSAEAGNSWGMAEWAGSLFYGKGVHRDLYSAIRWYEKSAAENEVRAMLDLAMIYDASDVVAHDYVKAARYYRMAADAGHPRAMLSMAIMYCNGRGVTQDLNAAQFWLSRVKPWRFPETPVVEAMIRRRLQTPGQRAMWRLSIGFAAFTGLLGVVRLRDIRRRLEVERRDGRTAPTPD